MLDVIHGVCGHCRLSAAPKAPHPLGNEDWSAPLEKQASYLSRSLPLIGLHTLFTAPSLTKYFPTPVSNPETGSVTWQSCQPTQTLSRSGHTKLLP
jgi:hypothetical protein